MKIALQLYTVRDSILDEQSLYKTLESVKAMGYEGVEFAGFFNADANTLKQKLNELSLTPVCCHLGVDELSNIGKTIDMLNTIGCKAAALAWSDTSSVSMLNQTCELLKNAASDAKKNDIELYYHNHDHEFKKVEEIVPIDKIKESCKLELDTFWSFVAGYNSSEYLRANKNNVGLVHIKDGTKPAKYPCALGEGENDIKQIVKSAEELGYEWIIVENDNPVPDGLSDAKRSIDYLKSI